MTPEEIQKAEDTVVATTEVAIAKSKKDPKKTIEKSAKQADVKPTVPKSAKRAELEKIAREYSKSYPTNKVFHICTDCMVFLEQDFAEAKSHQSTIGGEVESITIE